MNVSPTSLATTAGLSLAARAARRASSRDTGAGAAGPLRSGGGLRAPSAAPLGGPAPLGASAGAGRRGGGRVGIVVRDGGEDLGPGGVRGVGGADGVEDRGTGLRGEVRGRGLRSPSAAPGGRVHRSRGGLGGRMVHRGRRRSQVVRRGRRGSRVGHRGHGGRRACRGCRRLRGYSPGRLLGTVPVPLVVKRGRTTRSGRPGPSEGPWRTRSLVSGSPRRSVVRTRPRRRVLVGQRVVERVREAVHRRREGAVGLVRLIAPVRAVRNVMSRVLRPGSVPAAAPGHAAALPATGAR